MGKVNRGIAYGVGVGPGDPELMTLKAVRTIMENEIIALPGKNPRETLAYRIAVQAVPEIDKKELISIEMPMTKDKIKFEQAHIAGARLIESYLENGKNVVFLTLGDPSIYCTFSYIQHYLNEDGYESALVSGVPSFCAAAARLNIPLAEWDESITVLPAVHALDKLPCTDGTLVIMKSASRMSEVKSLLASCGREACAVINCGMDDERVHTCLDSIPDDAGYFSLLISKDKGTT